MANIHWRGLDRHSPKSESKRLPPRAAVVPVTINEEESSMKTQRRSTKKKRPSNRAGSGLRVIREKVAGIDLGAREHWVCSPVLGASERVVKVYTTTTPQLNQLADWLEQESIESVAMESTGVYWIPLYEILEARGIEVVLANARQLSYVPGRKTDMQDCQWLQLLHSCGLLRGSFRPSDSICQFRALQRERANLVGEATRALQRMQKSLDQMNIQVHHAVTDLAGKTGMAIVRSLVEGERDPHQLAALRDPRCRKSEAEIAEYLTGNWRSEHLFNLKMALHLYDQVQEILTAYDEEIKRILSQFQPPEAAGLEPPPNPNSAKEKALRQRGDQPLRTALWRFSGVDLTRIDGISSTAAQVVLSEAGYDLQAFPSEGNFVSWLRLSPNTPFSAGKPLYKKNKGTGSSRIAAVLRMAALSLKNSPTAMGAYYRRMARRKTGSIAVFATARKIATHIYRMLRYGQDYVDEGAKAYEERFRQQRMKSLKSNAKSMGYKLVPLAETG